MGFPYRFRFRLIPALATLLLVAIGILLAQWQTRRALEKEYIERRITQLEHAPALILNGAKQSLQVADIEYRRLQVRGEFIESWPVYLENRPYHGVAGFYLLMPFRIAGSNQAVLIERGWLPRNPNQRNQLPRLLTPQGEIKLEGRARRNAGKVLQLGAASALTAHAIVQNLTIAEFSQALQLPLQPFILEQSSDTGDGLVRDWPRPSSGAERHRGYAFQWAGLALMALIFFIVTGLKREVN